MRHFRMRALALTSVLVLSCVVASSPVVAQTRAVAAAAVQTVPDITFTVSMPQPHTHLLEVEMRVRNALTPAQTDLMMPVWTPGSYLVREFERHVQDFEAKGAAGRALAWRKVNKNTWRVETGGQRDWRATYRVYANELTVRTSELNDRHAFWNNAALLMHIDGQLAVPSTLRVVPYKDWKVATGLQPLSGERNTFLAPNFDVLYDSPVLSSDFKTLSFEVRGVQHRIIIDGDSSGSNYDPERLRRDTQKIVEATTTLMGDVPYRDYTFILMLRPGSGGGGLEHLNSTALIASPFGFRPEPSYINFLSLVAHEFFHVWNVKLIRPDALGPFDYTKENYTRLLWVAEGVTSYYEDILLRRAGLITDKEFLERTSRNIQGVQNIPGRLEMSAEEASFDAWIKFYRQDENSINSQISYYDKGNLIGLLLDLRIRALSGGARSLDDVIRYLYTEHAKKGRNFTPEDFQRAAEVAAGRSMDDFFSRYVRGRDELDYDAALAAAGLRLDTTGATDTAKPAPQKTYLGATLVQEGERLVVRNVPAGTPAYEQGLNANDQIVAIDGVRASLSFLNARIDEKRSGEPISLSVFRFDELRTLNIKLGARIEVPYRIAPVSNPNAEQKKIYQSWLGVAPPPAPPATRAASGQ